MKYTEILNRRLKKAGREYRTGNHSDKKERLWNAIQEIMEEAEGTGSFLPWTQAVQKLKLNEQQQMLIAVLWGTETYGDRLSVEEFRRLWIQIYEEEPENMKDLPVWYYFNEEYVELCPVLSGWLEGTMPVLPSGVQFRLTEEKKSYGLEELLAESHRIFSLAEQTGDPMILCLTGAAGSGREYAMEQICAGQDLALLLIDGETFRGTERELNACILSAMLYEAYPCVWLGKTERWELLEKMRESFSFYGVIREEGRALAERPEASVITRKLEQPDRKLKQQMAEEFQLENDIKVSTLSRYPEILTMEEQAPDEDELWSMLAQAIREACTQFTVARTSEGEHLKADLVEKLHHMASNVEKVEQRAPQILTEYRAKLQEKVQELLGDTQIDEARLSTEIILFADKICTDEETVRLKSHITSMLQALEGDEGIGRKLDFIAQEMNREANTILSKSNDLETSGIAIELKTEIEKVREQIQNIE